MKIEYKFVTGTVEVEVPDEWETVLVDLDRQEYNNDHKETRRHCSLEAYNLDDGLLPSDEDVVRDILAAEERQHLYEAIMGIVNGIKGAIGAVKDAVGNVASTIKSFLHFSVPDEGPLTDYESWMPDFMAGLANGIEQSRGAVRAAIGSVADDLTLSPTITAATSGLEAIRNGGMAQSDNVITTSGNSEMAARLDAMYEVVTKYLPRLANRQIVLDSGTLVGELSDGMNRTLGRNLL